MVWALTSVGASNTFNRDWGIIYSFMSGLEFGGITYYSFTQEPAE